LFFISGSLLLTAGLLAQNRGMTTDQTRALTPLARWDRSTWGRSRALKRADDPTIAKHPVTPHEPVRAARKAAEKAEHLAKKKQQEEAIAKYREAVALDPLYFEAWNNLALELKPPASRMKRSRCSGV
jgi:tetratricopeptide (TPR) repeat protein